MGDNFFLFKWSVFKRHLWSGVPSKSQQWQIFVQFQFGLLGSQECVTLKKKWLKTSGFFFCHQHNTHLQLSTSIWNHQNPTNSLDTMSMYVFVIVVWNKPLESTCEWRLQASSTLSSINNLFAIISKGNNNFLSYSTTIAVAFSWPKTW